MEVCLRHQFFLVVADFNREHFLNYILHDADPDDLSFLGLKLIGPFDLFVSKRVYAGTNVPGPHGTDGNGVVETKQRDRGPQRRPGNFRAPLT